MNVGGLGTRTLHGRVTRACAVLAMVLLLWIFGANTAMAQRGAPQRHPLDPLVASEYRAAIDILEREGVAEEGTLYHLVTLQEPAKAQVLSDEAGRPPRQALCVVRNGRHVVEAIVDLDAHAIVSKRSLEPTQPNILLTEEWNAAVRVVQANSAWRAGLARRGLGVRDVACVPLTTGFFDVPEERDRRLGRVVCFDRRGTRNFWGRPVEGLVAVVDYLTHAVVRVLDTGVVPIPHGAVDFDTTSVSALRQPLRPIGLAQPEGSNVEVHGHEVRWQNWSFHFRIDPRAGLVVSQVAYHDAGRPRSILYQAFLSELFVPYMDPDPSWYFRTYLDAGEYGIGKLAVPQHPGRDCPRAAQLFEAEFVDDYGELYTIPGAASLFERYSGNVIWRHYEATTQWDEARRDVELVLRTVTAIGNYDYVFDWIFRLDGSIRVAVGATGVAEVKGVRSRHATDVVRDDLAYGHLVAEHTVAVNHDHFFCFRLDLDVDGTENELVVDRLRSVPVERDSVGTPRSSVWVVDSVTPSREREARLRIDLRKPALWRVVNRKRLGTLGLPVSYQLRPEANAVSLLDADDFPQRRAGFTDYHVWVTPYAVRERYAAGDYPNQSRGGGGLPAWTRADRPIQGRDIVVWYTLGFHHVVRGEDWPVMPIVWHGFELRPFDFFAGNPALDLPR